MKVIESQVDVILLAQEFFPNFPRKLDMRLYSKTPMLGKFSYTRKVCCRRAPGDGFHRQKDKFQAVDAISIGGLFRSLSLSLSLCLSSVCLPRCVCGQIVQDRSIDPHRSSIRYFDWYQFRPYSNPQRWGRIEGHCLTLLFRSIDRMEVAILLTIGQNAVWRHFLPKSYTL